MKGAIFQALAKMVESENGLATWHHILDASEDDGIFTSSITYDDARLLRIIEQWCMHCSLTLSDALRNFGRFLFDELHRAAPQFADRTPDFFDFLESIGNVIHIEVHKLDESAHPPQLVVTGRTNQVLTLQYYSARKLCYLAEGLLISAAQHFRQEIALTQTQCMHAGHAHCLIRVERCG